MNLVQRRRVVGCILALLAIWPLGQRYLVEQYLVNPWELAGFAMYVQPNSPVDVRIRAPSGEVVDPGSLGPAVATAFQHYRDKAETWGTLASTNALRTALRQRGLAHAFVDIEVRRRVIASNGAMIWRSKSERIELSLPD